LQREEVEEVEELAPLDRVRPHSSPDVDLSAQLKTMHLETGTPVDGF
jgi:hypothetical protein